ncbi:hypothetical protein HOY80DRAFT_1081488 [Tuber brumale]|nr:hypothetical protein HOY80DRAFT_1081488 [Tuber brumale]
MIILYILQTTFWFFVGFPFLFARGTVLSPAHVLLNIPLIKSFLFLTFDIWAHTLRLLNRITRGSLKLLFLVVKTCIMLMALASSIYPGTRTFTHHIPALLRIERNIAATWFTVFLTIHYIGLSSDGEVWRVMSYLRRNCYEVLIDIAAACGGGMLVTGTFPEWAEVVLYAAFAIVDVYQLDWVGDGEGRLAQRERFEVWELCARVIEDWRAWVESQGVSSDDGEDLEDTGPDTRTEGVPPAPNPRAEDPGSAVTPEPITTEVTSTPLETSHIQIEPQVADTPGGNSSAPASSPP